MVNCPSELVLDQLLEGTLPADDSQTVRDHLRECLACQNSLDFKIESPWLRDWKPTARGRALDQQEAPLLAALMKELVSANRDTKPHEASTAPGKASLPFLTPSPVAGELGLLGFYRIQAEIGRGGMGIVLRAWDEKLQRSVAIKIVRPELDDAKSRQRLVREAQAAASFRHDHAVTVHAVVDSTDAPPYLVMENLSGPTLAALLQDRRPLRCAEAVDLLVGVADALAEAHRAGMVHRDVKPTNILLDQTTGRAKLTDFGLARTEAGAGLTRESAVAGTPAYMSPEQAQGSKELDSRTDIYSLGMTLYELLTGEVPFHGAVHLVMQQVIQEEPRPPRQLNDEIPRDLETICLKSIAKEPGRRYQSASLFGDDLRRWRRGEAILARPAGKVEKLERWCRRNPRVALLTASVFTLLLVLGVGASLVAYRLDKDRKSIARERNDAVTAREKADVSAAAAQDHFEVALGSLNSLLQEVKRLDLSPGFLPLKQQLTETALKGLERISKSSERTPVGDQSVLTAHEKLSDLYFLLGKTAEARAQLEMLLERAEEQLAQEPGSVPALRGFARAHERLGDLDRYNYKSADGAVHYRAARDVRQSLQRAHPTDLAINRDLAVSLGKLADSQTDLGNWKEAYPEYQKQLVAFQALEDLGADPVESSRDFRFVEGRLGQAAVGMFDYASARQHYDRALTNAKALETAGAADGPLQITLALEWLGILALRTNDTTEAIRHFEECLSIRRRIAAEAPNNAEAQRNMCTTMYNLGDCHFQARELDLARQLYEQALSIYEPLAKSDPGLLKRQIDVCMTLAQLTSLETCAERFNDAAMRGSQLLAMWRSLEKNSAAANLQPARVVKLLEPGLAVLQKARQVDLADPDMARDTVGDLRGGLLGLRSIYLARCGRHEEAARLAEQASQLLPRTRGTYTVARCYALCVAAVESAGANTPRPWPGSR